MSVSNIDIIYDKVKLNNIKIFQEVKINKYKVNNIIYEDKEFLIQDPDGYLLRFNQ